MSCALTCERHAYQHEYFMRIYTFTSREFTREHVDTHVHGMRVNTLTSRATARVRNVH